MAMESKIWNVVAVACKGKEQNCLGRVYQDCRQLDKAKDDLFGRFLKGGEVLEIPELEPISHENRGCATRQCDGNTRRSSDGMDHLRILDAAMPARMPDSKT